MWEVIEKAGIVAACALAALACLTAAPLLILVYLYGTDVFREGVPPALERGPGDGLFFHL